MTDYVSQEQARSLVRQKIEELGSAKKLAELAGCERSWISQVVNGRKPVGIKLAAVLGLVPDLGYRREVS
jgi:hypothetical protein